MLICWPDHFVLCPWLSIGLPREIGRGPSFAIKTAVVRRSECLLLYEKIRKQVGCDGLLCHNRNSRRILQSLHLHCIKTRLGPMCSPSDAQIQRAGSVKTGYIAHTTHCKLQIELGWPATVLKTRLPPSLSFHAKPFRSFRIKMLSTRHSYKT